MRTFLKTVSTVLLVVVFLLLIAGFAGNPYLIRYLGVVMLKSWGIKLLLLPVLFSALSLFFKIHFLRIRLRWMRKFIRTSVAPNKLLVATFVLFSLATSLMTLPDIRNEYFSGLQATYEGSFSRRTIVVKFYTILSVLSFIGIFAALSFFLHKTAFKRKIQRLKKSNDRFK